MLHGGCDALPRVNEPVEDPEGKPLIGAEPNAQYGRTAHANRSRSGITSRSLDK
jgi:hypothetical protein